MFLPRPLIISIALIAALVLMLSFVPSVPDGPLLEIFTLGILVVIIVSWVYQRRDPGAGSSKPIALGTRSTDKLQEMVTEIKALKQHQKEILLNLPLGVCELDSKERIILWNRAIEKMTSINGERIRNTCLTDLEEPWLSLLHNFVQSNYTHLYKQGFELNDKKRTVNLHKSLIDQGQAEKTGDKGILLLIEDVTETEILEASLTHSERLASIGRLAAGVAHEIGNPITGIACLAQNIRDEYEDEELRHMARQIIEQTERTSKIVQSLVNFAHAGRPADNSTAELFRVRDCIDEAITLISLDKQAKAVNYKIDCPSDIQIRGDFQRLLQVLLNLINNSRDASHPQTTVWVCSTEIGNKVKIVVEDEGVGIPSAVRDRVFDPFFTTKEPGKGTGLGLSLVYSIVEDLAGNIDIISPAQRETGRGTRVEITLPAQNYSAPDTVSSTDRITSTDLG
ncbi:MAG: ATP-binding protein [Gammaproteobacteria bacterium]